MVTIFFTTIALYIDSSNFGWCFLPKVDRFCLMENGGQVASLQGDNVGHAFTSTSKVGSSCAFPARAPNAGVEGFMAVFSKVLDSKQFYAVGVYTTYLLYLIVKRDETNWKELERHSQII